MESILKNTKLFWQYPVITEETFYIKILQNDLLHWISLNTIIDKRIDTNIIFKLLINQMSKSKEYYTCCQHISFRKLIPLFKVLGIKIVYSPHKIKQENEINGVRIMPCPLYAVNI